MRRLRPRVITLRDANRARQSSVLATGQSGGGSPGFDPDDYLARLVKLVPGEVIAAGLTINGILQPLQSSGGGPGVVFEWIILAALAFAAFGWTIRASRDASNGEPPAWGQAIVAACAYVVWSITIGPPWDQTLGEHHAAIGAICAILATVLAPLFVK